jgi:hypothetical protein
MPPVKRLQPSVERMASTIAASPGMNAVSSGLENQTGEVTAPTRRNPGASVSRRFAERSRFDAAGLTTRFLLLLIVYCPRFDERAAWLIH